MTERAWTVGEVIDDIATKDLVAALEHVGERRCPQCGGELHYSHFSAIDVGIDTTVPRCEECDWQGDPE